MGSTLAWFPTIQTVGLLNGCNRNLYGKSQEELQSNDNYFTFCPIDDTKLKDGLIVRDQTKNIIRCSLNQNQIIGSILVIDWDENPIKDTTGNMTSSQIAWNLFDKAMERLRELEATLEDVTKQRDDLEDKYHVCLHLQSNIFPLPIHKSCQSSTLIEIEKRFCEVHL